MRLTAEGVATRLEGPLLFLRRTLDVGLHDAVEVIGVDGAPRRGRITALDDQHLTIEVLESTAGLTLAGTAVRFLGEPPVFGLAPGILGRVFNGVGQVIDGGPPIAARKRSRIDGLPINPVARAGPRDFIETGVTTLDLMNSLVRGQKLPIFSGGGLPHDRLAAEIARHARLRPRPDETRLRPRPDETRLRPPSDETRLRPPSDETRLGPPSDETRLGPRPDATRAGPREGRAGGTAHEDFAIVFAGIGLPHDSAEFFRQSLEASGALERTALFLNLASDSSTQRLLTPRFALTAAEYLAFECGKHVLAILTDMTNYAEALREVSSSKGEIPSRKGFPGYLYSDLATLFERAGTLRPEYGTGGTLTQLSILTMPSDDISHPIPDLTGYITEGQIVLSRDLDRRGVYPPVDVLPSLSRLMKDGTGGQYTHPDHPALSNQLYAAYARAVQARVLASVVGVEGLAATDRQYLSFGEAFESRLVHQDAPRTLDESMALGWRLLSGLPRSELSRLSDAQIARYLDTPAIALAGPAAAP